MEFTLRMIAITLFTFAVAPFAVSAAAPDNPYKNAKVGDTLTYKATVKNPAMSMDGKLVQTVTAKSDKEVTVKNAMTMLGKEQPAKETKIDLTKEFDLAIATGQSGKSEKLGGGTEKVKVGEKEYDCTWHAYKIEVPAGAKGPLGGETVVKIWLSGEVPGFVKMVTTTKIANSETSIAVELTGYKAGK